MKENQCGINGFFLCQMRNVSDPVSLSHNFCKLSMFRVAHSKLSIDRYVFGTRLGHTFK